MEEKDCNYLARLEHEKAQPPQEQAADGKQPASDSDSDAASKIAAPLHEAAKEEYVQTAEQVARECKHPEVAACIQEEKQARKRLVAQIPGLAAGLTEGPAFIAGRPALLEEIQQLRATVDQQAIQIRKQATQIRSLEARLDRSTDENHEAEEKQGLKIFASARNSL